MYVFCSCGQRHWGRYGAAGLLLTDRARTGLVLQKRGLMTHHGGTWALIGGAIERGESPTDAALREANEEEGLDPTTLAVRRTFPGIEHSEWTYTYVLAETSRPTDPVLPAGWGWESDGAEWIDLENVPDLPLHPSLRDDWPRLLVELGAG